MSHNISCEICLDLMPLVKDEVASDDSKQAVYEHLKGCTSCQTMYGKDIAFENSEQHILIKLKRYISTICLVILILGILFGVSLSANQFMFYNVLIMPFIGAMSYVILKKKALYVCVAIFVVVYLRWLYDSMGYAFEGDLIQAFVPPFIWSLIYVGLTIFGVIIAFLLHYGLKKE